MSLLGLCLLILFFPGPSPQLFDYLAFFFFYGQYRNFCLPTFFTSFIKKTYYTWIALTWAIFLSPFKDFRKLPIHGPPGSFREEDGPWLCPLTKTPHDGAIHWLVWVSLPPRLLPINLLSASINKTTGVVLITSPFPIPFLLLWYCSKMCTPCVVDVLSCW